MQIKTKLISCKAPMLALLVIGLMLFNGSSIIMATGSTGRGGSPNCATSAHQQTSAQLVLCYQGLLAKFSNKFLSDIVNVDPTLVRSALKSMAAPKQQPSLALLAGRMGYPGDFYALERQELTTVDKSDVDQGKVDPQVVKGYNATVDKPLFDQFINQLPTINNQDLDQLVTGAILATPPASQIAQSQVCNVRPPIYTPLPQVDSASDNIGDVSYHGDHVIDGTANIYLIFWTNSSFRSASPKYASSIEQFVGDFGRSPLYTNLMQYDDSSARCPSGARLAGTFVDTHPFPLNVLADQKNPRVNPKLENGVDDQVMRQEIATIAAQERWNTQDYHNIFAILPTISENSCGIHDWLHIGAKGLQKGSPFVYIPYLNPKGQGQLWCNVRQSPNNDLAADNAIYNLSYMLTATVSAPYADSWTDANHTDIAGKCVSTPRQVNLKTKGNVVWHGHTYVVAEAYDNLRHGCVLEGP